MLIGPFVNGAAVAVGGIAGAFLGTRIPERVRTALPLTLGMASIALGTMLIIKVKFMPAVVLALVIGHFIGELIYLEKGIGRVAGSTRTVIDRIFPPKGGLSHEEFLNRFVAIVVLFCASGTGIFGSMHEGMTGDPSILYVKAILDLFTAAAFATALGYAVAVVCIPQLAIQLCLAGLAVVILPMTNATMMADFSAAGGVIMFATGLRICGIKSFPVANMLPGLILIMPISYLWSTYIA